MTRLVCVLPSSNAIILDLSKFGGCVQEWPEFWDAFESTVHNNSALPAVDKFKYLRMYLMEPVLTAIGGFTLTAANYNVDVDLLKRRYGKEDVIQRALINDLLNLLAVYNDEDTPSPRRFHDAA